MNLLLDIGNTNVKWAWHDSRLFGFGEFEHADARVEEIAAAISCVDRNPDSIWIAGVAGPLVSALGSALKLNYGVEPEYLQVQARAYGVTVGYTQPQRLGVDRWLAMIGARAGCAGPLCVADAGSALTVDSLTEAGVHLGGVICPGITLMEQTVLKNTAEVAQRASGAKAQLSVFATDTAAAVHSGAVFAAVGLIERVAAALDDLAGEPATVFLTGGAASIISPLMRREAHVLRELVLRGMAIVVEDQMQSVND